METSSSLLKQPLANGTDVHDVINMADGSRVPNIGSQQSAFTRLLDKINTKYSDNTITEDYRYKRNIFTNQTDEAKLGQLSQLERLKQTDQSTQFGKKEQMFLPILNGSSEMHSAKDHNGQNDLENIGQKLENLSQDLDQLGIGLEKLEINQKTKSQRLTQGQKQQQQLFQKQLYEQLLKQQQLQQSQQQKQQILVNKQSSNMSGHNFSSVIHKKVFSVQKGYNQSQQPQSTTGVQHDGSHQLSSVNGTNVLEEQNLPSAKNGKTNSLKGSFQQGGNNGIGLGNISGHTSSSGFQNGGGSSVVEEYVQDRPQTDDGNNSVLNQQPISGFQNGQVGSVTEGCVSKKQLSTTGIQNGKFSSADEGYVFDNPKTGEDGSVTGYVSDTASERDPDITEPQYMVQVTQLEGSNNGEKHKERIHLPAKENSPRYRKQQPQVFTFEFSLPRSLDTSPARVKPSAAIRSYSDPIRTEEPSAPNESKVKQDVKISKFTRSISNPTSNTGGSHLHTKVPSSGKTEFSSKKSEISEFIIAELAKKPDKSKSSGKVLEKSVSSGNKPKSSLISSKKAEISKQVHSPCLSQTTQPRVSTSPVQRPVACRVTRHSPSLTRTQGQTQGQGESHVGESNALSYQGNSEKIEQTHQNKVYNTFNPSEITQGDPATQVKSQNQNHSSNTKQRPPAKVEDQSQGQRGIQGQSSVGTQWTTQTVNKQNVNAHHLSHTTHPPTHTTLPPTHTTRFDTFLARKPPLPILMGISAPDSESVYDIPWTNSSRPNCFRGNSSRTPSNSALNKSNSLKALNGEVVRPRSYSIASVESSLRSFSLPRSTRGSVLHSSLQDVRGTTNTAGISDTGYCQTLPSGGSRRNTLKMSESFEKKFFRPISHHEDETPAYGRFPVYPACPAVTHAQGQGSQGSVYSNGTSFSESSTVEDLISQTAPDLTVKPIKPLTVTNLQRISEYDNLSGLLGKSKAESSVGTYYCKPWDSNTVWQQLMGLETGGDTSHPGGDLGGDLGVPEDRRSYFRHRQFDDDLSFYDSLPGTPGAHAWRHTYSCLSSPRMSMSVSRPLSGAPSQHEDWTADLATCHVMQQHLAEVERDSASGTLPKSALPGTPLVFPSGTIHTQNLPLDISPNIEVSDDEGVEDDLSPDTRKLFPYLAAPHLGSHKSSAVRQAGRRIREFISRLSSTTNTTFGVTVVNFIKCTREGNESNPGVVMRNVRQFMTGIKNYLVQHGEKQLNEVIEVERNKLEGNEFLNIDSIIEGALHKCVIKPLKQHIYQLCVQHYKQNGSIKLISDNIKYGRNKTPEELGVRPGILPPQGATLEVIKHYFRRMQRAYSPLKKLENLLGAAGAIYTSVRGEVEDFLPMLLYMLIQCGIVSIEIEADYMWGLLHGCLLAGEAGYHLTTLSSAVHVMKGLIANSKSDSYLKSINLQSQTLGYMKIVIPDEKNDSIISKTLPIRPNMSAKDVCSMIAHRFRISNPQDYGLYLLVNGIEERMSESSSPQSVRSKCEWEGRDCVFAYKRHNARFAWPVNIK